LPRPSPSNRDWSRPPPRVGPDRAIAAHALEFLVLNGAEKLRLEFQRHFTYLVEKQSPVMRQFEASDLLRYRSGEEPFSCPNSSLSSRLAGSPRSSL
jgi:hypothetical protein